MAYTLISSADANNASSLNITNIPQIYRTLILDITISQSSAAVFGLRFNNDVSNSVYNFVAMGAWGQTRGTDSSAITIAPNMPANIPARFLFKIPSYNTNSFHAINWFFGNGVNAGMGTASYGLNAPISTINLAPSGTSTFSYDLWGLS